MSFKERVQRIRMCRFVFVIPGMILPAWSWAHPGSGPEGHLSLGILHSVLSAHHFLLPLMLGVLCIAALVPGLRWKLSWLFAGAAGTAALALT